MLDNKKEWLNKSRVDYFANFMMLWLAFNSWYKSHYSELHKRDRAFIDKIKTDFTGRNQLYTKFTELLAEDKIKENLKFKSDLESLYYVLNRAGIMYPKGHYRHSITFETALTDYSRRRNINGYVNLVKKKSQKNKIKLDEIFIVDDKEQFFACLIEIIYQIRCYLFHGDLEPTPENYDVIKSSFFVLEALIA